MPTELLPLPKYIDSKHSLFLSYAHDDDQNKWIFHLRQAMYKECLYKNLRKSLRKAPKTIHFSEDELLVGYDLETQLELRIKESFAMLLVVGKGYLESDVCKKELKFFIETFGENGIKSRLFIAEMTEGAWGKVKESFTSENEEDWFKKYNKAINGLLPAEFWDQLYPSNPVMPKYDGAGKGEYSNGFFNAAKSIADDLSRIIKEDWGSTQSNGLSSERTQNPNNVSQAHNDKLNIAISAVISDELAKKTKILQQKLEDGGARCETIAKNLFQDYEEGNDLANAPIIKILERSDALIVPFDEVKLIVPGIKGGGHLGILEREWQKLKKKQKIYWFKPLANDMKDSKLSESNKNVIRNLDPVYPSAERICTQLLGNVGEDISNKIRIRIQNNTEILVFELLKEKILEIWKKEIVADLPSAPQIDLRPLDLDDLGNQNDACGYVVVSPVSYKSRAALDSQIIKIEKALNKGCDFPGRIAVISQGKELPGSKIHENYWAVIECKQSGGSVRNPKNIDLKPNGEPELMQFLAKLLRKHTEICQSNM